MIVCLEGNIGSGKSTVLQRLFQDHNLTIKEEPISEWGPLLDLYYDNPAAWALPFDLKVLHSFCDIPEPNESGIVCVERSPGACRHVFGQLGYNDEHMTPASWDIFKEYHDLLAWEPSAYVYIDTPPDQCFERIKIRGRHCESGLTEEYLRRIEFQYTNFLKFTGTPTYTVDGTKPVDEIVRDIVDFLHTI